MYQDYCISIARHLPSRIIHTVLQPRQSETRLANIDMINSQQLQLLLQRYSRRHIRDTLFAHFVVRSKSYSADNNAMSRRTL
jgi:hypothetical protein